VEGAIEYGGRGRKASRIRRFGAGAGALLGGIFGGGKGAGIGSIVGGVAGLGTTAFHGHQKITLSSGQEILIRVNGPLNQRSGAATPRRKQHTSELKQHGISIRLRMARIRIDQLSLRCGGDFPTNNRTHYYGGQQSDQGSARELSSCAIVLVLCCP